MERAGKGTLAALCLIVALVGFLIAPYSQFYGALLAIAGIILFILILIYIAFVRSSKERKDFLLGEWSEFKKTGHVKISGDLKLVKGEKVIFGITPCYIEASSIGFSYFPRDIIMTDRRIAIGFTEAIFFLPIKESFGMMNIWYSEKLKENESGAMGAVLGGDSVASMVKINEKDGEKILDVEVKFGPLNTHYRIYHPYAAQIEELYRKANRLSK